ncbi:MAG: hypothetical protein IV094_11565 [Vitreoscilla sp.]|nr:hypothetical protein [Vitreoscilla sp.]
MATTSSPVSSASDSASCPINSIEQGPDTVRRRPLSERIQTDQPRETNPTNTTRDHKSPRPSQTSQSADIETAKREQERNPRAYIAERQGGGPQEPLRPHSETGVRPPGPAVAPGAQSADPLRHDEADAFEQRKLHLEATLRDRYIVRVHVLKGDEYRFRGNEHRVAFEDHGRKLSTTYDTPAVVRSVIDLAEAKGWQSVRIGSESTAEFRRNVWLEASLRGIKAIGYEPTTDDQKRLEREQLRAAANSVEVASGRVPARLQGVERTTPSAAAELATREAHARGVTDPTVLAKVHAVSQERQETLATRGVAAVARVVDTALPRAAPQLDLVQSEQARAARAR